MVTITNKTPRIYNLPKRTGPGGSVAGDVAVKPGESIDLPPWYLDELVREKGWSKRLDPSGNITQRTRLGSVDPEARVRAAREAAERRVANSDAAAAQAIEESRRATKSLERRLAELERNAQRDQASSERRIAELEAELVKRAAPPAPDPKPTPDPKPDADTKPSSGRRS